MSKHPYQSLPDKAFWRRSVAGPPPSEVDPVGNFGLRMDSTTKVATAGSCFAQHIARHLKKAGYSYYVAEPGHPILPASVRARQNYGLFSARYGNIYTARQLLQLFDRDAERRQDDDVVGTERDGAAGRIRRSLPPHYPARRLYL